MNRTQLINYLIRQRRFKRYLQIGINKMDSHFNQVICDSKTSVESGPDKESIDAAKNFFANNQRRFGLVFIDGYHTEKWVLKEIKQAFDVLEENGIIILHDCMPPDEWHQREPEAYKEGENWNGTVWKAALRTFNDVPYKCTLLDDDWGCGIIDTSIEAEPTAINLPEKLNYQEHYALLMNFKVNLATYLRGQVNVFYHLACMGNWQEVFSEQVQQLGKNGFNEISLTILGSPDDVIQATTICKELNCSPRVVFHDSELTNFERPALLAIENHAHQNDGYVLYLHSKGVSNPADDTKVKWRRLMMRELIEKWEHCVLELPHYDIIGVNWRDMQPVPHFCGNFWYASTHYLRTLPLFEQYYDNPRYQIWDSIASKRLGCEFWIGSNNQHARLLSLVCRNVDFCNAAYWHNKSA